MFHQCSSPLVLPYVLTVCASVRKKIKKKRIPLDLPFGKISGNKPKQNLTTINLGSCSAEYYKDRKVLWSPPEVQDPEKEGHFSMRQRDEKEAHLGP